MQFFQKPDLLEWTQCSKFVLGTRKTFEEKMLMLRTLDDWRPRSCRYPAATRDVNSHLGKEREKRESGEKNGADERTRTVNIHLGKVVLYH